MKHGEDGELGRMDRIGISQELGPLWPIIFPSPLQTRNDMAASLKEGEEDFGVRRTADELERKYADRRPGP